MKLSIKSTLTVLPFILCVIVMAQGCGKNSPEPDDPNKQETTLDWEKIAETSTQSLIRHFWNQDYGNFDHYPDYPNASQWKYDYWPQPHAMDVIIDAYYRSASKNKYSQYFSKWYDGVKLKNSGSYFNPYYDDEEWICLTMIRLYEVTSESKYLNTAQELWDDIKTGWNDLGGGGIAQTKDNQYSKNACSNGPAGIIAAWLYRINQKEEDLEWAQKIFDWEYNTLVDKASGKVSDRLEVDAGRLVSESLTYNQGTFVGLAHELFQLTKDKMYLNAAYRAASYTIGYGDCIDSSTGLLRSEGMEDGGVMKGIFIRYMVKLALDENLTDAERNKLYSALEKNATALWNSGLDKSDPLFGPDWSKFDNQVDLGTQVSGATLMEAMALYTSETK